MIVRKLWSCCICNHWPDRDETSSNTASDTKTRSLKTGNGLIDWIRLGNSGVDLTGVGGRVRLIYLSELRRHNTKDDAWIAIRGRVYNITHYMHYHPGGTEELMRGAGKDATELFDKIHPWINYDSLLFKCFVGPLRIDSPDNDIFFDANDSFPESDLLIPSYIAQERVIIRNQLTNYTTPPRKKRPILSEDFLEEPNSTSLELEELSLPGYLGTLKDIRKERYAEDVPPALFYDWEQTVRQLTIIVYTGPLSNPGCYSQLSERCFIIDVTINGWTRKIRLVPEETLREPIHTSVCIYSGKIEITVQKADSKLWKRCGEVTIGTATKIPSWHTMRFKVLSNSMLTHDTKLISMSPQSGSIVFPLGHHVRIHQAIAGSEYVRAYTPMEDYWAAGSSADAAAQLHLAVKRYDNGILSPMLTSLNTGDIVKVSCFYGTFQLHKLKSTKTIYLLAAGSGITPMLNLIQFMLSRPNPLCEYVHLLFFNKTKKDIMFLANLDELAKLDDRFKVYHILSNDNATLTGHKGRISAKLLIDIFGKKLINCNENFACICGPKEFTQSSLNILKSLGMEDTLIHAFIG
ncbi:cytochrome b5 reductase 4-like [Battus philenor]|uniref:cytochrome b5 reductase 4-like n=1 Tax=Battus philenor TaxID=42288 RepID=UPI0035D0CA49